MDARFRFTRLVRTQTSEIYLIWEEENRVGQLDLHYAGETVHATLILETDLSVSGSCPPGTCSGHSRVTKTGSIMQFSARVRLEFYLAAGTGQSGCGMSKPGAACG